MQKRLNLAALILSIAVAAAALSTRRQSANSIQDPFSGAWRLTSLEEPDAAGAIHTAECTGMLVFSRDGHISVQVMYKNPQPGHAAASVQYAEGGYEASFGRYEVNDGNTFTFHVEGALVRRLVGKDLRRSYQISGNQMIVKSVDPNEHWKVVWERY